MAKTMLGLPSPSFHTALYTRDQRSLSLLWLFSHSVMSDSFATPGLQPARLLCPQDPPGKNTGVGGHFLLQGIFPT